jgi:hypothetical protein
MSFGWWTILHTWETAELEKPSSVADFDTIHVSIISRLKHLSLTSLLPFIYLD